MSRFNPVSNATSNLPQSHVTHYDRVFVENLKAQTPFVRVAERRDLPLNSGNQLAVHTENSVRINQHTCGTLIADLVDTGLVVLQQHS